MFERVIEYIRATFAGIDGVQNVAFGVSNDINLTESAFPLVHIQWLNMALDGQGVNYVFEINVVKQRPEQNGTINVDWDRSANERTNYEICSNIVVKFITILRNTNNDIDIGNGDINTLELLSVTDPEAVTYAYQNMLDGVSFTLTVQVNNVIGGC